MKKRFIRSALRLSALTLCLILALSFTSCTDLSSTEEELRVVGTVAEYDVLYEELRFVAATYKEILTSKYGEGIFEGEDASLYEDMLRERVYNNLTANYAVLELCREVGISRDEPVILAAVDEQIQTNIDVLGSKSKYKNYLTENKLTDSFLRFSIEIQLLESELLYVYTDDLHLIETDDEEIYDIIIDEFICVRHIFIPFYEEGSRDKIDTVLEKLDKGEDFASLMSEYSRDTELSENGLIILEGYMTEEYEDAAFLLGVNEYSDVIEDDHGYYVIQRLPMQTPDVMRQLDSLKKLYQTYTFYSMIDKKQAELSFVPNEYCDGLRLSALQ